MKNVKETVLIIENWIKSLEPEKLETIKNTKTWNSNIEPFKDIINWYEEAKNNEYILGDKIVTEEEILVPEVKSVHKLLAGDWDDDFRWDELDSDLCLIQDKLFNYVYYTLKWDKDMFRRNFYNSMQFNDEMLDLFPPDVSNLITAKSTEKLSKEVTKIDFSTPRNVTEFCLKFPKEMEEQLNEMEHLHFIGYSKLDDNPIYQLKIALPPNFEIIKSIKSING